MRRATANVCFTPGKRWLEVILLLLTDLVSFVLAIGLVSIVRYLLLQRYSENLFDPQVLRTIGYVIAASVITLTARGLYPGWGRTSVVELKQIVGAITLAYVLISVVIFVQGASVRFSRSVFLGSWFFAVLWLPVGRFLVRKLIARFPWWGEPVVIIGQRKEIERVSKLLVGCPRLGLRPVAGLMLDCETDYPVRTGRLPIVPWSPEVQTE